MNHVTKNDYNDNMLKTYSALTKFDLSNAYQSIALKLQHNLKGIDTQLIQDQINTINTAKENGVSGYDLRLLKANTYKGHQFDTVNLGVDYDTEQLYNEIIERHLNKFIEETFKDDNVICTITDAVYISGKPTRRIKHYTNLGFTFSQMNNFTPRTKQEFTTCSYVLNVVPDKDIHEEVVPLPTHMDVSGLQDFDMSQVPPNIWAFDRETTKFQENGVWKTETYIYDVQNVKTLETFTQHGNDYDLLQLMFTLSKRHQDTKFFVHNLGFDGSALIIELFKLGYNRVDKKSTDLLPNEFTTLITGGSHYQYNVNYNGQLFSIIDSLKLIPVSIDSMSKSLGLESGKTDFDYDKIRRTGYKCSPEEINYIQRDTRILALGIVALALRFGEEKLTTASNAMYSFKHMSENFDDRFRVHKDLKGQKLNTYNNAITRAFASYSGGWVYLNPKYRGVEVSNVHVYDFNSMYPTVMRTMPLPYGSPKYKKGFYKVNNQSELAIYKVRISMRLKQGFTPIAKFKLNDTFFKDNPSFKRKYPHINGSDTISSVDDIILSVTSIDLRSWFRHYDINISYYQSDIYQAQQGMFDNYIDHFMSLKENAPTPGDKFIAKIKLNSLYGKFGSNIESRMNIPQLNQGRIEYTPQMEQVEVLYPQMASFITAYAREKITKLFQSQGDKAVYADTDSVHMIGLIDEETLKTTGIKLDRNKLGAIKDETDTGHGLIKRGRYLALKRYRLEYEQGNPDGTANFKFAGGGITSKMKNLITHENFHDGLEIPLKLSKKEVIGGVALLDGTMKLSYNKENREVLNYNENC